ncbi:transcription-repair coupling factor [Candidatus Margulisiibacteriota bacterium]
MSLHKILDSIRQACDLEQTSFSGMAGASSSAVLSCLGRGLLIITSNTEKAQSIKSEIELFSGQKVLLFPAPDTVPGEDFAPSKELTGKRLAIFDQWNSGEKLTVVAPLKAVMWKTGKTREVIQLFSDTVIQLSKLIEDLINLGYRRFDIVGERGEFSVRGGIVDIFPINSDQPVRLELVDDKIETLRLFDVYSQRSKEKIKDVSVLPVKERFEVSTFEHLPDSTRVALIEPVELMNAATKLLDQSKQYLAFAEIKKAAKLEFSKFQKPGSKELFVAPETYIGKIEKIPKEAIVVSKHAARLGAQAIEGVLGGGFVITETQLQVITDSEIFGESPRPKYEPKSKEGVADELLADLKIGDYVVHENYGIALYQGMGSLDIDGLKQEYLILEFDKGDKVYVPPSMAGLVEKYSSGGDYKPRLSRLGTKTWIRTRTKVKKELKDMTKELLELYAVRQKLPGFAFPPDDIWQAELANTFPFEETPDQGKSILDTKQDMESGHPMDRLICGDVGYGKTEVAIRAAAKAVAAGKQVAILVPTTILAEQHFNNFKDRFATSPFVIEMLSRFRSKKDQAQVVKSLTAGGVDIVIGTHRLFSRDIKFKDLGLLIIDEEQRFGVAHKEKLKKLKKTVDVLTLSATPIPRTLYMSLSGARDLSTIHTPPVDRSPIRTYVLPWSESVIREAVLRELDRGGQIYFVHNFVETIEGMASKIKKLVPEAKITVGHGQMPEKILEKTMIDFLDRKFDVLVCTSIIESGLDITNVNTILIDQAERFGLSQLYQIRGRVGRSTVRAYAYLFYHPQRVMTDEALKRLQAIQEFTALGSGYKLAMRDLEIRGAGNLLGSQQSGHVMAVGFDLYCELLEEAVREVKGTKEISPREVAIDLKVEAFIPEDFVTDDRQRIALYRRMNLVRSKTEAEEMKQEIRERFGRIPDKLNRLFDILYLRIKAQEAKIKSIKEEKDKIQIEWLSGKSKKIEIKGQDKIKLAASYIGR